MRRKYSLERLVELVGPPETVLTPTTLMARALEDGGFSAAERARAELIDGERSLSELSLGAVGAPLGEVDLYALAWSLVAVGAARVGADTETHSGVGVRAVPTLVTSPYGDTPGNTLDRRTRPRPGERPRDRDADRAIDKERVLAKRAQVQDGDYFAMLGLGRDASAREVARAFERLKREFAPERFADPLRQELSDALAEIGEVLDEAHRVLADDDVRASYRAHLSESAPISDRFAADGQASRRVHGLARVRGALPGGAAGDRGGRGRGHAAGQAGRARARPARRRRSRCARSAPACR